MPLQSSTHLHTLLSLKFIRLVVCLTTGPKPLPKPALHIVRSRASSFKWEYHLLSLRSSSSFLYLLPRLPVTSIPPFIFPSITRCRRQFLCKMWPIQLAFPLLISCRIFLCSLTLSNTSLFFSRLVQLIFFIIPSLKYVLILSSQPHLLPSFLGFLTKILYSFLPSTACAICPTYNFNNTVCDCIFKQNNFNEAV